MRVELEKGEYMNASTVMMRSPPNLSLEKPTQSRKQDLPAGQVCPIHHHKLSQSFNAQSKPSAPPSSLPHHSPTRDLALQFQSPLPRRHPHFSLPTPSPSPSASAAYHKFAPSKLPARLYSSENQTSNARRPNAPNRLLLLPRPRVRHRSGQPGRREDQSVPLSELQGTCGFFLLYFSISRYILPWGFRD